MSKSNKKTVIIGATPNPSRFAHRAAHMLVDYGHAIVPIGLKKGNVAGEEILDIRQQPVVDEVDTLTLYVNPTNQQAWYDYLLQLAPKRIIFNPGTENPELAKKASAQGIEVVNHCTLVMLQGGIY